jgi:hypothetical protein
VLSYPKLNMLVILAASCHCTLKVLCLHIVVLHVDSEDAAGGFWKLRFPALQALEITYIDGDLLEPRNDVTDFFLAHANTLQRLTFDYPSSSNEFSPVEVGFVDFGGKLMLRSLATDEDTLDNIVEQFWDSISPTLTHLHIFPHQENYMWDFGVGPFENMIDTVTGGGDFVPAFPYLEHFRLTLNFDYGSQRSAEERGEGTGEMLLLFQQLSKFSGPKLREMTFSCPRFPITALELASAFESFPTLEKITIEDELIGEDSTREDFALALAAVCPLLKEVIFMPADYSDHLSPRNASQQRQGPFLHVPIEKS